MIKRPKRYTFDNGEWEEVGEATETGDIGGAYSKNHITAPQPNPWKYNGDKWVMMTEEEYRNNKGGIIFLTHEDPNEP